MRNLKRAVATAAVLVGVTSMMTPAYAASSDCDSGRLCLWDDNTFSDTMKTFTASEDDMNDIGFGDKTSSAYNRSSKAWVLYGDHDYGGAKLYLKSTASVANMDKYSFGDKTSSAKIRSDNTCPSGVTVVGAGPH